MDWSASDGTELRSVTQLDLGTLALDVDAVLIDAEGIQLVMPAPHPDLDAAVGKLEGLVSLGARLSGKLGGYR